jgi:hypothetical protein
VVSGRRAGKCTITARSKEGSKAACEVTVTASTLPAPWSYQEINSPAVPGCAGHDGKTFTITGGGMAIERWWQRVHDQFSFVSRRTSGDADAEARVTSQTRSSPRAVAGLMFRASTDRDSRFVLLGVSPSREVFLSWRDGPDDEGPRKVLGKFDLPVSLRLRRRGQTFEAYVSRDGRSWGEPLGRHAGKAFKEEVMVGLCVTAHNNPTTSTATFDHVSVKKHR